MKGFLLICFEYSHIGSLTTVLQLGRLFSIELDRNTTMNCKMAVIARNNPEKLEECFKSIPLGYLVLRL
jgi:hypothetical protein